MTAVAVNPVAHLPFGEGAIGRTPHLATPEAEAEFAAMASAFVRPLTVTNTADCVDDRPTIALGNVTDPDILAQRVTYQLPGGLGLAFTKAAVASDAAYLRDITDMTNAYLTTVSMMVKMGFTEAGHTDCGASKNVEKSVSNEVPTGPMTDALKLLTQVDEKTAYYLSRNWETKHHRLESGFYGAWSQQWHEGFLGDNFAENFSILQVDHDNELTHGHNAEALLAVVAPGYGFAKTDFARQTGRMAFGFTPANEIVPHMIEAFGGSDEEKARLSLELLVDPAQVLNGLTVENFPVLAAA